MNAEAMRCRVTAAELVRRFGQWQEQAMIRPVFVTHHGRDRLLLLSMAHYAALGARGRPASAIPCDGLLDQLAEGFVALDAELHVRAINPVAAAYLKAMRGEALGTRLFERMDDLRRSMIESHLTRALESGEIGAFDMPSAAFEGRWLHVRTFPYEDGAACLLRDITEEVINRRMADAKLATLAALAAHGAIGRGRLSQRGTFADVDPTLEMLTGFEADALLRARLTDLLPLNRRVAAQREIELVLSGGAPGAFDSILVHADGRELPIRIALAELRGDYASDGAMVVISALPTAH